MESGHSTDVASLMEGERSCYRGVFNRGSMVMLQRRSV